MIIYQEYWPQRPGDPEVVVCPDEHDERLYHHDEERTHFYHCPLVLEESPPADPARLEEQLRRHKRQRGDLYRAVHLGKGSYRMLFRLFLSRNVGPYTKNQLHFMVKFR